MNLIWLGAYYILIVCLSSTRTILFFIPQSLSDWCHTVHKQFYKLDMRSYSGRLQYKGFQITTLHFVHELDAGVGKNLIYS